jgi:hypothetical protein
MSISSVGSSASLSTKTIETGGAAVNPGTVNNAVGGGLGVGVDVTSTNSGTISNYATIQGDGTTPAGISGDSVSGNIGISAVGSSASASNSTTAQGAYSSPVINTVDVSSLTSSNTGNVATVGVIDGGSIAGGIGNSVSTAAVGSSASMSNSVIMQ